jgi:clan AA aspartic protease
VITGVVNALFEATVLTQFFGQHGATIEASATIDTGYNNGAFGLPSDLVSALGLVKSRERSVRQGDGTYRLMSFYDCDVEWDGVMRQALVLETDSEILIGTAALKGYHMEVDWIVGGPVRLIALTPA